MKLFEFKMGTTLFIIVFGLALWGLIDIANKLAVFFGG